MSELRQDIVSKDWLIISPERGSRPHAFTLAKSRRNFTPRSRCPFEHMEKSGNWPPLIKIPNTGAWDVVLMPNKYPAVVHDRLCTIFEKSGPYKYAPAIGHHDIIVTRDHTRGPAEQPAEHTFRILRVLQMRYRALREDACLTYTSAFMNWGLKAGASISHPHFQVLTLPIIPPNVKDSLDGSRAYFKATGKCIHCATVAYERRTRKRIVFENSGAVVIAPFASRQPFEMRIFPKRHRPYFEETSPAILRHMAAALRGALVKLKKNLNDPDMNFFIHSSPIKNQRAYKEYHWHIEVVPKIALGAGFELSTGLEINPMDPDRAAKILRK